MAKQIHGIIWLLVGIVVTVIALWVGKLLLFVILGVACIAFGGYKVLVQYMTKPKESKTDKFHEQMREEQRIKYCSRCGAPGHIKSNFCNRCGSKV
ncbi:hypothetical protein J4457_07400 [Candidatus Woesearchaeota archaeon]|nr:hypothetical protein [Candidatus Woesearchaeota archaeon]